MNYIYLTKIALLIFIYLILYYTYKKIDWHSSSTGKWENILIWVLTIICFIPLISAVAFICYFLLLKGTAEFLNKEGYLAQIILLSGYIMIYFATRIWIDSKNLKKRQEEKTVIVMREQISFLLQQLEEAKSESNK